MALRVIYPTKIITSLY